ncbi:uncharacterized protein LOC142985552 [Anticarsia gemmatalis]|uniref:uncharacterized protein LOC142985552 n=1 Tax=Anticarsia gemmatalis TaxID=129554 RepID=UPI003F7631CC
MRMYVCENRDEVLQLVSRTACIVSAPYISNSATQLKGAYAVHHDPDVVLRYIKCRDYGRIKEDQDLEKGPDPRCIFQKTARVLNEHSSGGSTSSEEDSHTSGEVGGKPKPKPGRDDSSGGDSQSGEKDSGSGEKGGDSDNKSGGDSSAGSGRSGKESAPSGSDGSGKSKSDGQTGGSSSEKGSGKSGDEGGKSKSNGENSNGGSTSSEKEGASGNENNVLKTRSQSSDGEVLEELPNIFSAKAPKTKANVGYKSDVYDLKPKSGHLTGLIKDVLKNPQ